MLNIEKKIEALIQSKVEELGYELYDVEYVKEGKEYYLRIYIDLESGIDLNDCEKVTRGIDEMIDEADLIDTQYFMEVSSPGVERKLTKDKHLEKAIGKQIEIKTYKQIDGKKDLVGTLKSFDKDNINIEIEDKKYNIDRKDISVMKLSYDWNGYGKEIEI